MQPEAGEGVALLAPLAAWAAVQGGGPLSWDDGGDGEQGVLVTPAGAGSVVAGGVYGDDALRGRKVGDAGH